VDSDRHLDQNDCILKIRNLEVGMPGERVKGIDLEIRRGEIFGIGGLAGQGKIGIANGLMGVFPARGEVEFNGTPLDLNNPKEAIKSGLSFVSEDRKGVGLLLDESIELNIIFSALQIHNNFLNKIGPFWFKDSHRAKTHAENMIKELDIRCRSGSQRAGSLSGGNQQKVCLARALTLNPKLLLVSEPTRGIDIGAKKLVIDLLLKLNKELGITIVMTSSELAELRSICDQIAIVCEGRIEGILPPDASDADFGLMMSGSYNRKNGLEERRGS
jgi:simple sugar transport system ATP-binding protein